MAMELPVTPSFRLDGRRALVTVVVAGGVVDLLGMVTSEPERAAS